jgi:AraC-like DNA-binding protein
MHAKPADMTSPRFIVPFLLSTKGLNAPAAASLWRDFWTRAFAKVAVETPINRPLVADARVLTLPGIVLAALGMSDVTITRSRADAADANKAFVLVICMEGSLLVRADERAVKLGPREATVLACGEPSQLQVPNPAKLLLVLAPASVFEPLLMDMDGILGGFIEARSPALELLINYLTLLQSDMALENPALRAKVVAHLYDLVAFAVSTGRDVMARGRGKGAAAAKFRTIKADVLEALSQRDLSAEMIAQKRGLSPRYIRRLFEKDGQTFTEFVMEQRLLKAHALLTDPSEVTRPISAIAQGCGFAGVSYFNRVFRKRYGITPTVAREGRLKLS